MSISDCSKNNPRLYVTIDTEMDANPHWKKPWPPEYTSIYEGIPNYYRPLWDKYDVHPIYFLSPEILMDDKCCEIFRNEIEKGAIIGAHLHPEYIEPEACIEENGQTKESQFPCSAYSTEIEEKKIKNLTELIERRLGVRPKWYRAARFGADVDTYGILDKLGYEHESSVTPGINWRDRGGIDYKNFPLEAYKIDETNLLEHPVTIVGKRWGFLGKLLPDSWLFYRWLRPTHMSYIEMRSIINNQLRNGNKELIMMFHSMEIMINKTPYVRNRLMQKYYLWRLDRILKYSVKRGIAV